MDPRLPYALGALAGMVRADAANAAASDAPADAVSDVTAQAMAVANQLLRGLGEERAIRSGQWGASSGSPRDRLLCAVPVGIAMSTINPEVLADTVWAACGCTNRNEFQSAALLAVAVSLLINNWKKPTITTLCDAVDVVSAMKPRGQQQDGPDVLSATRRAINVAANSNSPLVRVRTAVLLGKLADVSPSCRIVPLAFFQVLYPWATELPSACRDESGNPELYDVVSAALAGACDPRTALRDVDLTCIEGVHHVDVLGVAGQLLTLSAPTPLEYVRRAAGKSPDRPSRSGPSSFEDPDSDLLNRFAPFEPDSTPTPLGPARGNAPVGRVVVMSELLLRFDRHSSDEGAPTEDEWATREDVHLALPFTAMCAARAMGVEVVSLSPIGQGPRASIIAEALAREGIIDAGPRVAGCDNGFLSPPVKQDGASMSTGMTDMPEDAWDEAIRTLGPSDVLYVDGGVQSQAVLAACEHALAHLPDHVRVILDASHGHVRQRSLPNDNVLIMVGYDAAESLCRSITHEKPGDDCTKNPRWGAKKVQRDFHQYTLNCGQTHESYLARAVLEEYPLDTEVTRFPAPTVTSVDVRGALHTSMGVMAAALAQGQTLERCILLANCAGALASTMPGPASCPTREEIESSADALTDRGDEHMRRRDRAYGALAGASLGDAAGMPTRGMSPEQIKATYPRLRTLVDADASHPTTPGAPAGTTTEVTREILAAASALLGDPIPTLGDEAEEGSGGRLAGSRYMLRAIAAGITTSTADPNAFAEAVWEACANEAITRQEFQAAALVAAAISIGLDSPQSRPMDVPPVLWKAVSLVADLPPRGTWHPGPDVVVATRTAVSIADNYKYDVYERLNAQIGTSADPTQSVPAAFAIVRLFADGFAPFGAASLGGDTSVIAAIAGSIIGAIQGSSALSVRSIDTVDAVFHLRLGPLAERLLAQRPPAAHTVAGTDSPTQSPSSTASTPDSPLETRQTLFEPENTPVPLVGSRGEVPAGRVVVMGQILVEHCLTTQMLPWKNGLAWANDQGVHIGGIFPALLAARRMGVEAISLSPIGDGPRASSIEHALKRAGIVDAGARVTGMDNAYRVAVGSSGLDWAYVSLRGAESEVPPGAWASVVQTLGPSDVLYIDSSLMSLAANRKEVEAALKVLPEHVRVVVGPSPASWFPHKLRSNNVIVALTKEQCEQIGGPIVADRSAFDACKTDHGAARFLSQLLKCQAAVYSSTWDTHYASQYLMSTGEGGTQVTHIPGPAVRKIDTNGAAATYAGALAAFLAQGIPLERALLLANCAGALASTMPGPASCPTRQEIEAAADALEALADEE